MLEVGEREVVGLAGGLRLAYRRAGDGEVPVVFIHGYSLSADLWERVMSRLPPRYSGYAYDMRGFGRSGGGATYGLEDHAADIGGFLDALGLARAVLVGHSLGANVMQIFATAHPERVLAMVLSNGRSRTEPPADASGGAVAERMAAYGSVEQNRAVVAGKMPTYFAPGNATPEDVARFVEIAAHADTQALRETLLAMFTTTPFAPGRYADLKAPTMIITGALDRLTPLSCSRPLLSVLPDTEVVEVPGSGHSTMWERPDEWSRAVYGFLDRRV